jgi:peptidyl-prolyl cis-trans isomerase SurA
MNKKIVGFLSLLLAFGPTVIAQRNVVDEVVWVVGDEAILLSDVEEQRLRAEYEGTPIPGNPYCYIPEQLALQKLYLDQARIDSINIDDKQVQQQVEQRINYLMGQLGSPEKVEAYFGKPMDAIRDNMSDMVRNQLTIQQEQHKIVGDIKPTPAEVRRFFNQLPADSIPMIPEEVEVQVISVSPKVRQSAIDAVKNRLYDFQKRVESGESSFSTLAVLYSEDMESAKRGGELGYMGKGQLVPEYAEVAFALKDPTKVSRIVKSDYGYHIIQLIDRKDDRVNTRHILLKPEIYLADRDSAKRAMDSLANTIRLGKMPFEAAVSLYSTDKNTKNSEGLLTNPATGDTKFNLKELSPYIASVISPMNIGEISRTFAMKNSNGDDVYTIVKLKNRVVQHKANMSDDYITLKNMYVSYKSEEKLHDWIAEKQKNIYVKIGDKWKDCDFQYPDWIKDDNKK